MLLLNLNQKSHLGKTLVVSVFDLEIDTMQLILIITY